ncbi:MAG: Zn-dependent exopeptidase M28 [Clostridia bacterium]|nr:Zn-dependent exopeptidase M28 [Clostridia bacterium]
MGSGNGRACAPLYLLESADDVSLSRCCGKIVLSYKQVGAALYEKLCKCGAVGYIVFNGSVTRDDRDIDEKRIGFETDMHIPGVCIHLKDVLEVVRADGKYAELCNEYREYEGYSQNIVLDLQGNCDETVVIIAHYDTTEYSHGAYDNMSGCIALLHLAEYFSEHRHERNIRLVWCGAEEVGLIGSRAYCRDHKRELEKVSLCINLDLLGCVMGNFVSFSCIDETMESFLADFAKHSSFPGTVTYGIRSSDSNSFIECGVPTVSFARYPVGDTAISHTRYDTAECVDKDVLMRDIEYIAKFADHAANAPDFPKVREISVKIKQEVEKYMSGKLGLL